MARMDKVKEIKWTENFNFDGNGQDKENGMKSFE